MKTPTATPSRLAAAMLLAVSMAAPAALAQGQAGSPSSQQGSGGSPEAPRIETARDLLVALEKAGEEIRTLRAGVRYDRRFRLQGDRHIRDGVLWFRNGDTNVGGVRRQSGALDQPPSRAFAIEFATLRVGERLERDPQVWIFDGRWLVEVRPAEKQFVKREIAKPGDQFDPLRVGEGPMPIPIGQKASDILARYEAELLAPTQGLSEDWSIPDWLQQTWQLRLTPRPGANPREEFREIRLWYSMDGLLPRMAKTVNRAGDESWVFLSNPTLNEPLPDDAMSVDAPTQPGWQIQVEELPEDDAGMQESRDERRPPTQRR